MESTIGSGNTITIGKCELCLIPNIPTTQHTWSPFPSLIIKRHLCKECGTAFTIKTATLADRLKAQCHCKLIDWEAQQKLAKQIEKRQLRLPKV